MLRTTKNIAPWVGVTGNLCKENIRTQQRHWQQLYVTNYKKQTRFYQNEKKGELKTLSNPLPIAERSS